MDRNPDSRSDNGAGRLRRGWPAWLSVRAAPDQMVELPHGGNLAHHLTRAAVLLGMIAAVVGAGHLAAWLGGYMSQRGLSAITMKTNAALCLTLVGVALMLLVPARAGPVRHWAARACAALALLVGLLTFVENLSGWDFGIDQLLAAETPGALAVVDPNRMGTPASLSFTLIGLALLLLSRREPRRVWVVQALALAVCVIALLPTIGFLYGAERFYGIARYTGIAWPTAVSLLLLGLGLLCTRPAEGLMAQITGDDPGGVSIRRLLPTFVTLLLLLGWLRLAGERAGVFDAATGTGMMMLLFIIIFSVLTYHASRGASRSAQTLRESEERFRALVTASSEVLYRMSADWSEMRRLDSRGFLARTERPSRTWLGEYIPPDDQPHVTAVIQEAIRTKGVFELEHRVRRADGSLGWTFSRAIPLLDANGEIVEWFGSASDITEQKQAQEALRESEAQFRALFENMEDGFAHCQMVFDAEGRPVDFIYLNVNSAFGRLTGLENVVGKRVTEVLPGIREIHPELLETYARVVRTGRPERLEIEFKPLAMWLAIAVYSPQPGHFAAVFDNITERKRAEEALREWNATLESKVAERTAELQHRARQLQKLTLELTQAEEKERRRIAVILHEDLQQQIAGARFHLNLVRNRARDDRQRADVDKLDAMLTATIEKSRTLSHDLSPAVLHMNDLAEVLRWLAHRVRAQHGLVVKMEVLGDTMLHSEALAMFLFRAVQEMLFNVVKHAGVKESTIRVKRIGRCVALSVVDQGRGFDPQELKETSGFGLLSIRERVSLLGGRMTIKSVKGQGSRVRLVVPDDQEVVGSRTSVVREEQEKRPADHRLPDTGYRLPLRVLLVDDHDIVREGLAALLQEAPNIEVVGEAADGREAISMTSELRPDVVLMDVSMPVMSGDEATRQIKTYLPETRVIALSMYDEADKKERMFQAGAEGYILKTVSAEELLAALRGKAACS